jgi:hypothetical protein
MDQIDLARSIVGAGLKFTPVAGLLGAGSITVAGVQAAAYILAGMLASLQIAHLAWQWNNERRDRSRKRVGFIRPRLPVSRDHE